MIRCASTLVDGGGLTNAVDLDVIIGKAGVVGTAGGTLGVVVVEEEEEEIWFCWSCSSNVAMVLSGSREIPRVIIWFGSMGSVGVRPLTEAGLGMEEEEESIIAS